MSQDPRSIADMKQWIDTQCDKLTERLTKRGFENVEQKDNLMGLIESGVFLSAILGEMKDRKDKVKKDQEEKATLLYREFRSIVEDMEKEISHGNE